MNKIRSKYIPEFFGEKPIIFSNEDDLLENSVLQNSSRDLFNLLIAMCCPHKNVSASLIVFFFVCLDIHVISLYILLLSVIRCITI